MSSAASSSRRFALLDTYRGFIILHMIAFHFLYDAFVLFGETPFWYTQPGPHLWQQYICCSFILLSGWVSAYGRRHGFRRGLIVNLAGLLVTAVSLMFMPDAPVWFGVLNLLGCGMWLIAALDRPLAKTPAPAGLAVSLSLFALFRHVATRKIMLGDWTLCRLPAWLYRSNWLVPFGLPPRGFASADYFPLLPWLFLYIAGYFLGRWVSEQPFWNKLGQKQFPPLSWLGRHSLLIYLLHQPLCYAICWLIWR